MPQTVLAIVTRPFDSGENLSQLLIGEGIEVARFPMLEMESCVQNKAQAVAAVADALASLKIEDKTLENLVKRAKSDVCRAIFVSANAVRFTASLIGNLPVADTELIKAFFDRVPCVGMGRSSEAAIAKQGWKLSPLRADAVTTEDLLRFDWAQADQLAGQSVMVCRGRGGRTLLGDELVARGANVGYLESYQRVRPVLEIKQQRGLLKLVERQVFVILASGETATNFFVALYEAAVAAKPAASFFTGIAWLFVAPSLRVKEIISEEFDHFLTQVGMSATAKNAAQAMCSCLVASNASDAALVDVIKKQL